MSFTFQRNADGTLTVRDAVMQALGRASVCWSTPEGAGVFDATAAEEVGNVLLETLDEWLRAELRAAGRWRGRRRVGASARWRTPCPRRLGGILAR